MKKVRPKVFASAVRRLFGAKNVEHERVTPQYADIDVYFDVDRWGELQSLLDLLPDVGEMRMTLLVNTTSGGYSSTVPYTDTDETVDDNGIAKRPTLPESTANGSSLFSRVYGDDSGNGGGWKRAASLYGAENVSNRILLEFRYPPNSPYS